jgi:hypothetical protein
MVRRVSELELAGLVEIEHRPGNRDGNVYTLLGEILGETRLLPRMIFRPASGDARVADTLNGEPPHPSVGELANPSVGELANPSVGELANPSVGEVFTCDQEEENTNTKKDGDGMPMRQQHTDFLSLGAELVAFGRSNGAGPAWEQDALAYAQKCPPELIMAALNWVPEQEWSTSKIGLLRSILDNPIRWGFRCDEEGHWHTPRGASAQRQEETAQRGQIEELHREAQRRCARPEIITEYVRSISDAEREALGKQAMGRWPVACRNGTYFRLAVEALAGGKSATAEKIEHPPCNLS